MDLTKLVEFLQSYPIWFRLLVSAWIFLSALIPIGLLLVDRTPQQQESAATSTQTASITPASRTPEETKTRDRSPKQLASHPITRSDHALQQSYDAYIASYDALEGLFAQQEDFNEKVKGMPVSWQGRVWKVSGITGEKTQLEVSLDSPTDSSRFFIVKLPNSYKTQAASLQAGMLMSVDGTIQRGGKGPTITAGTLTFISK